MRQVYSLGVGWSHYNNLVGDRSTDKDTPQTDAVLEAFNLACHGGRIVAGIELKFIPRGAPDKESINKDVLSLSHLTSMKRKTDRASIGMPRYRQVGAEALKLRVLAQRKLILAVFCSEEAKAIADPKFWKSHAPRSGFWNAKSSAPMNFAMAVARAQSDGTAEVDFKGKPFEQLGATTP